MHIKVRIHIAYMAKKNANLNIYMSKTVIIWSQHDKCYYHNNK